MNIQALIYVVFALILMITGFYFAFYYFKLARLLEDTPTSRVRSASQGFVELFGYAKKPLTQDLLQSPLNHMLCVWFKFTVERRNRHSKKDQWQVVESGESSAPFLLDDRGDHCVIHAKGASITTVYNKKWHGQERWPKGAPKTDAYGSSSQVPNRLNIAVKLMDRIPKGFKNVVKMLDFGEYRYSESLIQEGNPLYVLGDFSSLDELDHLKGRKETHRALLKEWKKDPKIMQKIDTNNDGQVDAKEWQAAVQLAEKVAEKKYENQLKDSIIHHIKKPTDKSLPFIVSSKDQTDLIRRYRWYSFAGFVAFFGGGILAVYFIRMV